MIYFFLLLFIAFNIGLSQPQPALPPVPIMSDNEQIDVIIKTLTQALIGKNANQLKAIYREINNTNIAKNTLNEGLDISAIDIDKLKIDKNIASTMCKIQNCKGELLREQQIIFEKHGFYWQIKEAPELISTISAIISNNSSQQNSMQKESDSKTLLTTPSILISNNILIKIPHPWTNNYQYQIDAGYTWNNIQRRLFSDDVKMDIDAVYPNLNPDDAISFHLDHNWDRILYAQKSGNWIKSYGDHAGDHKFINPKGMAIDVRDTIYVADSDNSKIVKLFYNAAQISFVSSFSINGIIHPVDIDIDQSGTLLSYPNPQGDLIWIADDYTGKIVAINRAGEIKKTIEYYAMPRIGTLRLAHPLKVLAHSPSMIAFIDRDRMAFVTAAPPPTGGTVATAYYSTEFDKTTSDLTCIGQDLNNEWWVGDIKQKMYHKFTANGEYLASYKQSDDPAQNFQSPVSITKAPYYSGDGSARCQYIYTSDLWGTNTGMRAFFPGVDALNISFIPYVELCYAGVKFILTNQAYVRGRLTLNNDTTTIAYYDYGVLPAGTQTLKIDKFKLKKAETYYKFTIEIQPRYWLSYQIPPQGRWWYYSIEFRTSAPVWAASITPVPSDMKCFSSGWTGTWKVTPTCPIGFYSYKWYRNQYIGDDDWGYFGENTPEVSFRTTSESFELRCDVTHRDGDIKEAYYPNCSPYNPPTIISCPFVYTWDGFKFQEDNNILPQSAYPNNTGKDVTDYYRLRKILNAQNGKYILQIREFENEKSYLDHFRLIAVDHPANTKIDVSATGEIYQYITPFALNRARTRGLDVTQNLSASDSNRIIVNPGDTLHISVLNLLAKNSRSLQTSVGGGEGDGSGLPKVDKMASVIQTRSSPSNPAGFTFRQRPTLVYTPMTLDSTNSLDIIWTQKAKLDYFNYGLSVPQTYTSRELSLSSAVHSSNGDVTAVLLKKDFSYSTLMPGQSIELRFNSIPGTSSNKKRTFILLSEGRYETIEDSSQSNRLNGSLQDVTSFKLDRNYPNPFNPVTRINFQLPVEGHTSLIIYDLLGREVARLIDGFIEKGYHSIEWDASSCSSGLYFCRFTVSDGFGKELYSDIQKLLVMR
jgi:hypothetical protein